MAANNSLFPHIPSPKEDEREDVLIHVRGCLADAFPQVDDYHGAHHHEHVLQFAHFTAQQVGDTLSALEYLLLDSAVLLHDIGYSAYEATWSPNRNEHVQASIDIAQQCLPQAPYFQRFPALIDAVCFLIARHDDTSYKFPSTVWQGNVGKIGIAKYETALTAFASQLPPNERQRLSLLLAIVREADALTAAGSDGAERTFRYSTSRGLPIFAEGNPLNAWCWEESAVGNTRLAAKRALIDAFTHSGRRRAHASYLATESYIAALCADNDVAYYPETLPETLQANATFNLSDEGEVELLHYAGWATLEQELRDSASPAAHYQDAALTLEPLSVATLSAAETSSASKDHAWVHALQERLNREYALSLFDLAGTIILRWNAQTIQLTPPLIDYREKQTDQHGTITDKLERVTLAHQLHLPTIWAVSVTPR